MSIDEIISKIEAAGMYWAACREGNKTYSVVVGMNSYYIGDELSDPCSINKPTLIEALTFAYEQELGYIKARAEVKALDTKFGVGK